MKITGKAIQITVYIGENDRYEGKPLATAIVERALEFGIDGATVFHGREGFGAHHEIHSTKVRRFKDVLPVVVVMVARSDRGEAFLPKLDEMVSEGLVTVEEVEIRQYRADRD